VLVHLVPIGRGKFELYAEPPEVATEPPPHDAGRLRHWLHNAGNQWRSFVDTARLDTASGRVARWRDALIRTLADSIDEQHTMWSLRTTTAATALYPAQMTRDAAHDALNRRLADARRFHGIRFAIYLTLFVASGILFFVPGPNVVAYYLGFQAFGHMQSWRGARQATSTLQWTLSPSEELAELDRLKGRPHQDRASQVEAIAARLGLPRLPAFFERAVA
jgi:hypothetical protein